MKQSQAFPHLLRKERRRGQTKQHIFGSCFLEETMKKTYNPKNEGDKQQMKLKNVERKKKTCRTHHRTMKQMGEHFDLFFLVSLTNTKCNWMCCSFFLKRKKKDDH